MRYPNTCGWAGVKKTWHRRALGSKLSAVYHAICMFCTVLGSLLVQQCYFSSR